MLGSYLQQVADKLTGASLSGCDQPWNFHCHIKTPTTSQPRLLTGPPALQLQDVLVKVLSLLDSQTLCTSVPLVCQQWHLVARSPQPWANRLDPQVLAAAEQEGYCTSVPLPLLHYAVYGRNLLRNPTFQASQNADYTQLFRSKHSSGRHDSSSNTNGSPSNSRMTRSVISNEQRRLAWVTTVGDHSSSGLSWESPPVGLPAHTMPPPPPLRYPAAARNSSSIGGAGLSQQLQIWLAKGLTATTIAAAKGVSAAVHAAEHITALSAGAADTAALAEHSSAGCNACKREQQQEQQQAVSCLGTGGSWGEVVQVIDLVEELCLRGLTPATAASILDSGGLALGFSVWVAAPEQLVQQLRLHQQPMETTGSATPYVAITAGNTTLLSSVVPYEVPGAVAAPAPAAAAERHVYGAPAATHAQQQYAQFAVALMLDDGQVPLRSFQTFVKRQSSHHFFSKRLTLAPGGWRRYAYALPVCPPGCRRAVVLLRGRGSHPGQRAGSAAKFASAELVFMKQSDVAAFGAEETLASWSHCQVVGL